MFFRCNFFFEFFEVVVDGCRWFEEVLGGCKSFLLLVTTNYAHQKGIHLQHEYMIVIQLSITWSQFLSIVYFSLPHRVDDVQMIVLPALTNYIFPGHSVLLMLNFMFDWEIDRAYDPQDTDCTKYIE